MIPPTRFACDQDYLRDVQYRSPERLAARANLHRKYRTAKTPWFCWLASQVDWPPGADVLEVGCGPGWLWEHAVDDLPDGLRLTLTDLSGAMVETAVSRVAGLGKFDVAGDVADAQRLPFPGATFDLVVANHMLYHVREPAIAVAELARVLRPAGQLLAAANGPHDLSELWEIRTEVFGQRPDEGLTRRFGALSGLPMIKAVFGEVEWRTYADQLRCTDPADVIAYLTSFPPGEDAGPEIVAELSRAVHDRFENGSGVFTITKDSGAFVACDPRPAADERWSLTDSPLRVEHHRSGRDADRSSAT